MKKLSKIVSVVLSLVLCLGMASPAFAASFADLQNAINSKEGTEFKAEDGSTRYGYAENKDDEGNHVSWGIEAWNGTRAENVYDENGNVTGTTEVETRNVQLNEDVKRSETEKKGIGISGAGKDITIDLNGNDINGNNLGNSVVTVDKGGKLTLEDSSGKDESGKYISAGDGKITGGGTGIENGSTVVIKGGDISQNSTRGVWNRQDSTLIMEGGSVSENTGLGVFNQNGTFLMTDGDITGNCRDGNGAGVGNGGKFTMNGGTISDNTATKSGGAVNNSGTFTMNNGTIRDNSANVGAGVYNTGTFKMNGGTISENESSYSGGGVCNYKNFAMTGGTITDNSSKYTTYGALYNDPKADSTIPEGTVLSGKGGTVLEWEDGAPSVIVESKETTYYFDEGRTLNKSEREDGLIITVKKDGAKIVTVTVPVEGAEKVVVNSDGSVDGLPANTTVKDKDGNETTFPNGGSISADGTLNPDDPPAPVDPVDPVDPVGPDTPDVPVIPDNSTGMNVASATIADQEVPLAGLVSRQLLVSALYVRAGSPDGEDAEGEYTKALAWAVANGIIDQDTDPEEVVTAEILRDVMTRYAKFLDVAFDVEIPVEDDEIVMNCNEILEKFFAAQEDKAA